MLHSSADLLGRFLLPLGALRWLVMQGSLVGQSNSSSSDADVAPLGDDEADELAALVLR